MFNLNFFTSLFMTTTQTHKAKPEEMAPFYHTYLNYVTETDVLIQLRNRLEIVKQLWGSIPPEKHDFAYATDKWTIKQVLGHIIDTERIFACRALCIARGETQALTGFDENAYVINANFTLRTLPDLLVEFDLVRQSTLMLFENLAEQVFDNQGIASQNPITVRALASITVGHEMHHSYVLQERYL
ncbi:MAG: DinB family protein [Verrucomicrobia bacterium]|nr:DinB family protein [Cytophagales bacterium]